MKVKNLHLSIFLIVTAFNADAQSALEQAMASYQSGEYEKALSNVEIAVSQHASPDALMLRADCLQKLGDYSKALDEYDKAKSSGYAKDDLLINRGICKTTLGLMESARIDLLEYIRRNEEDPRGYYWMGQLEYLNMENKASLRYLDEALWRDSTYADAYYLRAANYADQRKLNLALEDFQEAYVLDPKMHRAKLNIAIIMLDMGQNRNAMEVLSELKLENIDFTAEVLYYRGEALYNIHDMEGAFGDWFEAAEMGYSDAEYNYRKLCIDKHDKPRFKRRTYFQF
ncbi:MAG: tetratricopeptide repeat protein [Flavobacteriales bacterium]|nr:tetratricopeptide repeat protein [Flavobacteriales bacterium]